MSGGLFEDPTREPWPEPGPSAPLAERMRPRRLEEYLGQEHLLGAGRPLRLAFEQERFPSMILWGPPGTGKTTLALLVARRAGLRFRPFSAVLTGIPEVRSAMQEAARARRSGQGTLVFVDEIHRFNKAQQDAFLPFVERGDIVLVGATTENPSFEVIAPLLSRVQVHILEPLDEEALLVLLRRALEDRERGLGARRIRVRDAQLRALARYAGGDARRALGALEAAARTVDVGAELPDAALEAVFQGRVLLHDKAGDRHFDLISALHKSIRSSDPDAALYWLARMVEAGEDRLYLARRLIRIAAEDIGLADPSALRLAIAAREAWRHLGEPEGDLALAELAVYLAVAPKSDAVYRAWEEARREARQGPERPVPLALRNAPTALMKERGWGRGYEHAHEDEEAVVAMECLPEGLEGRRFYAPRDRGLEARIRVRLQEIREAVQRRREARQRES